MNLKNIKILFENCEYVAIDVDAILYAGATGVRRRCDEVVYNYDTITITFDDEKVKDVVQRISEDYETEKCNLPERLEMQDITWIEFTYEDEVLAFDIDWVGEDRNFSQIISRSGSSTRLHISKKLDINLLNMNVH